MLRDLLHGLTSRIPSSCAVCHAWPAQTVCNDCVARFAQPRQRCSTCALIVPAGVAQCGICLRKPPPLDTCLASVSYGYPWSDLIGRFKFGSSPGWAMTFAQLMRSTPWVEPALDQADWVIALPLSAERLKERGFNQALELSRQLSPDKCANGLLLRVRHTRSQSSLKREDRLRNLDGAFAIEPLRHRSLHGKRVVLVDDVMTSGASLFSAATILRQAGVAHITGLVIARTE